MNREFNAIGHLVNNAHIPPHKILAHAVGQVKSVVVIGIDKDNDLYLCSSDNINHVIDLIERALADLKGRF